MTHKEEVNYLIETVNDGEAALKTLFLVTNILKDYIDSPSAKLVDDLEIAAQKLEADVAKFRAKQAVLVDRYGGVKVNAADTQVTPAEKENVFLQILKA